MIKVKTQVRLYRDAKLKFSSLACPAEGSVLRVTREGPSIFEDGFFVTLVEVERSMVQVGDYTISAALVE